MTAAAPSTHPTDRLHGLDALRGFALLLGVVLHAAMAYTPFPMWVVVDSQTSPATAALFFAIHLFRMTAFFLIAGLFAHMMIERRGVGGFIRDRLSRIAGPLSVFWGPTLAAIIAMLIWVAIINNGGTMPEGPPPPPLTVQSFPLTHLWFLWVLLILYAVLLLLRAPFAAMDRSGGWGRAVDRVTGPLIGPWTPAVLAAPLAVALYLTPNWIPFFGVPTPDTGLLPNPAALTAFGVAFGFGALIDRRRDLLKRIGNLWAPFSVMALGTGTAAFILSGGAAPDMIPVTDPQTKAGMAALYAFAAYAGAMAAMALALRFASGVSGVRRYLADASYWIYIVHLPLVMTGQVLMLGLDLPWFAKLAAVIGGVMAVSLITYELLIRHSFMGRWLNGRRVPWRRPPVAAAPPAE